MNLKVSLLAALACLSFTTAYPQANPITPQARGHFAMTYDERSAKVVLAGGVAFTKGKLSYFADYWTWDGKNWDQVPATEVGVMGARLTYDAKEREVLMFGGVENKSRVSGALRMWNGIKWVTLASEDEIGAADPGFVYDSRRDRVVAFVPAANGSAVRTYEWNGRAWRPSRSIGPYGKAGSAAAFDAKRGVSILFGGDRTNDVWEFDGLSWQRIQPASGPGGRMYPSAVYDDALGTVVVHGGAGTDHKWSPETWAWDGKEWKKLGDTGPALEMAIAYDKKRDRIVGVGTTSHEDNKAGMETWEFDGTTWTKVAPVN